MNLPRRFDGLQSVGGGGLAVGQVLVQGVVDEYVRSTVASLERADGAWISTDDEEVLARARATFEEHRDRAVSLTEDDFPE